VRHRVIAGCWCGSSGLGCDRALAASDELRPMVSSSGLTSRSSAAATRIQAAEPTGNRFLASAYTSSGNGPFAAMSTFDLR